MQVVVMPTIPPKARSLTPSAPAQYHLDDHCAPYGDLCIVRELTACQTVIDRLRRDWAAKRTLNAIYGFTDDGFEERWLTLVGLDRKVRRLEQPMASGTAITD